jgi:hypothetical protein
MVGMARFERATPASRTQCPTKLGHIPTRPRTLYNLFPNVHRFYLINKFLLINLYINNRYGDFKRLPMQ